ncbi:MAG: carbamoyltransferase [Saprospiraceae bacterium]
MKNILGISAFYHDSAAALLVDGQLIAAAQEERFNRQKNSADFPSEAIRYCLDEAGLELNDLDAVVFYDKPLLKFERLLQTYYTFAPRGLISFLKAIPVWLHEKLFFKRTIQQELKAIGPYDPKRVKLLFSTHHLSHAASAFYPSGFEEAAILTLDGVGEWSTATIGLGQQNQIQLLRELHFPHSLGLLYSAFTYFLGFKVNNGEYKLMGLAPYGKKDSPQTQHYIKLITEHLVQIKSDGSIHMNQAYFRYATGLRMVQEKKWAALFGFPARQAEEAFTAQHYDLAQAIQQVTETIILKMATTAKTLTNAPNLCLAGGVALNCVANQKLQESGLFEKIFVQPAAGDAGAAHGAALAIQHLYKSKKETPTSEINSSNIYLGPAFSRKAILKMQRKNQVVGQEFQDEAALVSFIAQQLAQQKIVGWFQGRMEFGPRALGNRSILADPRTPGMQQELNLKIKFRESFRPFAPAVLEEDATDYFEINGPSPFMTFVHPVKDKQRSKIPAVTHLDGTARVQTVSKHSNPRFYNLLQAFKQETDCSLLINTSFNVRGEPIVCTPIDAFRCFQKTNMDFLVIENFVYCK